MALRVADDHIGKQPIIAPLEGLMVGSAGDHHDRHYIYPETYPGTFVADSCLCALRATMVSCFALLRNKKRGRPRSPTGTTFIVLHLMFTIS
jgi:hypothetical protein